MKILKLLNKKNLSIFFISFLIFLTNLEAEDKPVDIWKLKKKVEENSSSETLNNEDLIQNNIELEKTESNNSLNIVDSSPLTKNKINISGLYDPEKNALSMEMWSTSDGNEIKSILNKLKKTKLSKDSKEILDIALLTNSYFPKLNITEEEFIDFKLEYLIENNDKKLIKSYLIKNENNIYNSKLIKFYINSYTESADLENACKIFDEINYFSNDYINKFKIYCLINQIIFNKK